LTKFGEWVVDAKVVTYSVI